MSQRTDNKLGVVRIGRTVRLEYCYICSALGDVFRSQDRQTLTLRLEPYGQDYLHACKKLAEAACEGTACIEYVGTNFTIQDSCPHTLAIASSSHQWRSLWWQLNFQLLRSVFFVPDYVPSHTTCTAQSCNYVKGNQTHTRMRKEIR